MGLFDISNDFYEKYSHQFIKSNNLYKNIFKLGKNKYYKVDWAQEYSANFTSMIDKESIKKHLDNVWDAIFEKLDPKYKSNLFFAGGCFQSLALNGQVNDYDLFCNDYKVAQECNKVIQTLFSSSITDSNKCLYFYAGDYHINFVKRCLGDAVKTINSFDFEHCKSYYYHYNQNTTLFSSHLGSKELIFNESCSNAIGAVYRLKKFLGRNYTITNREINKIFKAAQNQVIHHFYYDEAFHDSTIIITKDQFSELTGFYQGH